MDPITLATTRNKKDLTESRWEAQQAREDAMERAWQEKAELSRLANLFGI